MEKRIAISLGSFLAECTPAFYPFSVLKLLVSLVETFHNLLGIIAFRQGNIICTSDGKTVSFSVKKNPNADTLKPQAPETTPVTTPATTPTTQPDPVGTDYIGNKNSKIFHYASCASVKRMNESNKYYYTGTRDEMIAKGYKACQNCNP
jgi:hypothetical protein